MWGRIRRLLAGSEKDSGLYFYVRVYQRPRQASPNDEIVKIRVHPTNDISKTDDGQRFVRKTVVGSKTFRRAEATLYLNAQNRLIDHHIENGELAGREEYEVFLAQDQTRD